MTNQAGLRFLANLNCFIILLLLILTAFAYFRDRGKHILSHVHIFSNNYSDIAIRMTIYGDMFGSGFGKRLNSGRFPRFMSNNKTKIGDGIRQKFKSKCETQALKAKVPAPGLTLVR